MGQQAPRSPLSREQWRRVAALAERLEEAWDSGGPVALGPLLPPPDDPVRDAALRELVKTDLEIRCRRGRPASLDKYLEEFPELAAGSDDALTELVYEEYRVRQRHGDRPPLTSYQARFPRLYDALRRLVQDNPVPTLGGPAPTPAEPAAVSVSGSIMESNRLLPIGGGYVLESLIGRGGFGEVWRARAPGGVLVAVKIIRRPADHEERIREERALEVVKQLHHHFLAKTHQYHSDKDSLFIVMDLCDCSLRDRLREVRKAGQDGLPITELAPLFREAAEALDYLHGKGALHRDIKPDNILLLEDHVRLADFGLARLQEQQMMSVSGSGTFAYMAPEVWGGHANAMSDQYSLAYSYAELRLGHRPFSHTDFASLMFDHMQREPALDPMPEAERHIVLQALAKLPEHRFPTCVDFARALERLAENAADSVTHRPAPSARARATQGQPSEPMRTQVGAGPPQSIPDDEDNEPGTRALNSLLPTRSPRPEPKSVTGDDPRTSKTARTAPPILKRPVRRRPWAGFLVFLTVVVLAVAGFVVWLTYFSRPQPQGSITLVMPTPLELRAGEKRTVSIGVKRKNFNDPVELSATAPPNVAVSAATIPAGADAVTIEIAAAPDAVKGEGKIHFHAAAGALGGDVDWPITVLSPAPVFLPPGFRPVGEASDGLYPGIVADRGGIPPTEFVLLRAKGPGDPPPFYIMKTKASNALATALGATELKPGAASLPALGLTAAQARQLANQLAPGLGRLPTKEQYDRAAGFSRREWPVPGHAAVGRIDVGPRPVDDPADDDVTPEGVRDLFGDGTEFTRGLLKEGVVPPALPKPESLVILRGWSFAAPRAMTYDDLQYQQIMPQVQYERAKSPYTGFRVVIEPPP